MQEIVDKYDTSGRPYLLPIIKNMDADERRQYKNAAHLVNDKLKKIGEKLGLAVPLTSYCAPHTKNTNPAIAGNYIPEDHIFFNLWDNSCWDGNDGVVKTVYDPCPIGYHVSSIYTFAGFTENGESVSGDYSGNTYAVTEENMLDESAYRDNIVEFYTNKTKLISIGFLANGYRDWDDNAKVW